jgi:hypothetical protein
MWQEIELIQQNLLQRDRTVLFISQRLQRPHRPDNHWPLLEYTRYSNQDILYNQR